MISLLRLWAALSVCCLSLQSVAEEPEQLLQDAETQSAQSSSTMTREQNIACVVLVADGRIEYRITQELITPNLDATTEYGTQDLLAILSAETVECVAESENDLEQVQLSGRTVLTDATLIEADVIHMAPDTELITSGFELQIRARKHLVLKGKPQIRSFLQRDLGMQLGSDGRNAGLVSIEAAKIEGSQLVIDNSGEDGSRGEAGSDGKAGARGKPGRAGTDKGIRGCVGRKNGGVGERGKRGKPGGRGGHAGNGGPVSLRIDDQTFEGSYDRLVVKQSRINPYTNEIYRCKGSCPGAAGLGGEGGNGGEGGPGGLSPRGQWPCIGGGIGKSGQPGKAGKRGASGRKGQTGSVLIY